MNEALVERVDELFSQVSGTFYRAVDPLYSGAALAGSHQAGRYSRAKTPTLYVSSSRDGVDAAMLAHSAARSAQLEIVELTVEAERIVDLRSARARAAAGVALEDAATPWQETVRVGGEPPSWAVRDRLEALSAVGLIDPSRKVPGLWYLVLFRWNSDDAPVVSLT